MMRGSRGGRAIGAGRGAGGRSDPGSSGPSGGRGTPAGRGGPPARDIAAEHSERPTASGVLKKSRREAAPTVPTTGTARPSLALADPRFEMLLMPTVERNRVAYVPSFRALGKIARSWWRAYSTLPRSSSVVREFHELLFVDRVLRMAVDMVALSALNYQTLDPSWLEPWYISHLQTLNGAWVPRFLLVWWDMLGEFVGPLGSRFVTVMPPATEVTYRGNFSTSYETTLPNFVALRAALRNLLDGNHWDVTTFLGDGVDADREPLPDLDDIQDPSTELAGHPLYTAESLRLIVGLDVPPEAINAYIRPRLTNNSIRILANDENASQLQYYLQEEIGYTSYAATLFPRLQASDVPGGVLTHQYGALKLGMSCHAYSVHPAPLTPALSPFDSIVVKTGFAQPDMVMATYARLMQTTFVGRPSDMIDIAAETRDRYDPELLHQNQRSNEYSTNDVISATVHTLFLPQA